MTITNHTDLLNYLATTFNLQSYLEIGVRDPINNFNKITCEHKTGVDPETIICGVKCVQFTGTSDQFFAYSSGYAFDLIFIDGLHHADQVKRDFENSLRCLTDHGFIVIHDTLPTHEKYTHVPRDSRIWFGDVYKFAMNICNYDGIEVSTLDIDCGCTVVYKSPVMKGAGWPELNTWDEFKTKGRMRLGVVSIEAFKKQMEWTAVRLHAYSEQ